MVDLNLFEGFLASKGVSHVQNDTKAHSRNSLPKYRSRLPDERKSRFALRMHLMFGDVRE